MKLYGGSISRSALKMQTAPASAGAVAMSIVDRQAYCQARLSTVFS